jgi:hypothetical protein
MIMNFILNLVIFGTALTGIGLYITFMYGINRVLVLTVELYADIRYKL